ncbi:hypothetical protein [Marinibacterium sp. SX1]|uniref:hypothetical protein n=1 Tax=Marinibacterium sp. SX1 TaxID=3388424 RepID=UPI003D17173A
MKPMNRSSLLAAEWGDAGIGLRHLSDRFIRDADLMFRHDAAWCNEGLAWRSAQKARRTLSVKGQWTADLLG